MSYTVVGLFPNNEMADTASNKLDTAGFEKSDYSVSRFNNSGDYNSERDGDYDYTEDERTSGFWNWLFGDNDTERNRYSYAGTKSNVVTVYTDDIDRAERARDIMNDNGAINVNDFSKNYIDNRYSGSEEYVSSDNNMTSNERARILNKAKNDLYLTPQDRNYTWRQREGMTDEMDSMGNRENL